MHIWPVSKKPTFRDNMATRDSVEALCEELRGMNTLPNHLCVAIALRLAKYLLFL